MIATPSATRGIGFPEYFGAKIQHPDATLERRDNAMRLLLKVNALLDYARSQGIYTDPIDPDTGTCISGAKGGAGDGGFRLQGAATGRAKSAHKEGHGVDVYDPEDALDNWISTFDQQDGFVNDLLQRFGLHREHPSATPGWSHLQDVPPTSRRLTYWP